jgi:bloom syndrome protein
MDKYLTNNKRKLNEDQNENISRKSYKKTNPDIKLANSLIFGNDSFRHLQEEIIETIMDDKSDVFVIMPTGGGKSLLYQLPACLSKGVTIVISPLLSLIEEQVSKLIQLPSGGVPSAFLTSSCKQSMIEDIFQDLERANYDRTPYLKLLYTTPERIIKCQRTKEILKSLYFKEMLPRFVIDEVIYYFAN